ncbi:aminotransferase class I/II-fold pyridoxal phosphate-dependent enzyme [Herbiconiux sp. CPCC 203407]|uniref:cysteine-S-conjugate beta-lyase n=1 Tax=Herbiconiux oxytropis TaxID=2970915 RepID=A0AA41XEX8_9MICO|nr:aminotransferase class I/II-fold pyridoxal phosphate-dependent enzyme [Herbiconiux oxytropis]MCS5723629.1 aminotransferase class I/II-fold pyridoxal phosphate-dependent enzyme [Herbiconiux oxytropis]MCS5726946.1 aminotransferase class I/II-fold pyridoxal phosphate-dependent enzyme [Herbiconiux oxytropis]
MSEHPYDAIPAAQLDVPSSRKWSLHPGTIGAWVAEMDFGTAPAVTRALHEAVDAGVLGYLSPSTAHELAEATVEWLADEYDWVVDAHRVHPVSDVMAALGVAVTEYSPPGSAVIVPTPAYMPFLTYPPTLGRPVVEVPGIVENGRWRHDLDAIDRAFRAGAGTLVLCNPQNPTGTVLDRSELLAIAEVVERHDGRVFADEIHAPLRFEGRRHIPYASLSAATAAHTITGTSASKAWNIAGLKAAQLITSNDSDEAVYRSFGFAVQHGASTLGVVASTAAYRHGRAWLQDVREYLDGNRRLLGDLLAEHLPEVAYDLPDATYLAWLDLRPLGIDGSPATFLRERAGVVVTDGALCGTGYAGHVRLVFAMPRPLLREAVERIAGAVADAAAPSRIRANTIPAITL